MTRATLCIHNQRMFAYSLLTHVYIFMTNKFSNNKSDITVKLGQIY